MEENGLYAEEQKGRSCSEHLFVLTTIIKNRKLQGKSTFTAFLDIDRELLLFKLLNLGIKDHIYENIKAIYKQTICCINVNNMLTDWFQTYSSVIQGDTLSPTLFNIIINDLVDDVNYLNLGVTIDGHRISILLYADDILLLGEVKLKNIYERCLTLFTNGARNTKFDVRK